MQHSINATEVHVEIIPITNTAPWLLLGTKTAYFWHRFDQRYAKGKLSQPDDDKV